MRRFDLRTVKLFVVLPMVAMLAAAAQPSLAAIIPAGQSVTLDNLIAGDTIVVGDKVFSGFSYSNNGDMPGPTGVSVVGTLVGNSVSLQFSGAFRDVPGGGVSDAGLGFHVQVTDPLKFISRVRLAGTLTTIGNDAEVHIDEGFSGLPPGPLGFPDMYIQRQIVAGVLSPFNQNEDSVDFPSTHGVLGFKSFRVLKNIFADAGDGTFNAARVTTFTQTFDQEQIPEPATMALAGMSALAMVGVSRRRS
ncbi:MAG: PEP-CTERM sorting domain-containing protein [Pirellulales bacterium]|nr:PEP-CTERM sorting domain-containing protein [Pirellulales bacterium]